MEVQYRQQLERVLSQDRLAAYALPNSDELDTVTRYFWNISLCQALYPSLGLLEVAVRNSIDATLAVHFGRSDWYDTPGFLQNREAIRVGQAKKKIQDSRKLVAPGRVVAELNLGFWTSLLDTLYGNSPYGPQVLKSPSRPLLIAAFPNAPNYAWESGGRFSIGSMIFACSGIGSSTTKKCCMESNFLVDARERAVCQETYP